MEVVYSSLTLVPTYKTAWLCIPEGSSMASDSSGKNNSYMCGNHILQSQIRDSPNLEDQVPLFISPRNKVGRLYPQALGSFFVAFYDSLGYGGGIRRRLHTGLTSDRLRCPICLPYNPLHGPSINHHLKSTSLVACASIAAGTRLPSRYLETALLYLLISRSLHSNGSTRYRILNIQDASHCTVIK
jgi:hypothetical protein